MGTRGWAGEQGFTLFLLLNLGLSCTESTLTTKDKLLINLASIEFTFRSLWRAEQDYVRHVFGGDPPMKYRAETWDLIKGISFSTNSTDILQSSCTSSQCLKQFYPDIMSQNYTQYQQSILGNVTEFQHVFKQALNAAQVEPCHSRNIIVPRKRYGKKELGLKMLFSIRKWLVYLTNTTEFN